MNFRNLTRTWTLTRLNRAALTPIFLLSAFLLLGVMSCKPEEPSLNVVPSVDLERYQGTWYEIARLPNRFEEGLTCVKATYTLRPDGTITVQNEGVKEDDRSRKKNIEGKARVPDAADPARLKVTFFWPFSGDYQIIGLDTVGYQYALVGNPSRKFLWILAREKSLDENTISQLLEQAKQQGFATEDVVRIDQSCP
jgi:apolipoprotein D and lipocalin family protein